MASAHIGLPSLPLVVQVPLVANTCSGPHLCSDGRLLLAGGCPPFSDGRQISSEPGVLIAPAGLLAQADQPTGNGLVYPKVRQSPISQSSLLSSAVRVRIVGAFAQGALSSAVQACYHQHVLCCTALGVLEYPLSKDDAHHRPCPCSSSHQVQDVTAVVCQYLLFDTKIGKLECRIGQRALCGWPGATGAVVRRRCWPCGGAGTACMA